MITEVTKLTNGDRVVIPAAIRKGLGLQVGDSVTLILDDNGEVCLLTQARRRSAGSSLGSAPRFKRTQSGRRVISRTLGKSLGARVKIK